MNFTLDYLSLAPIARPSVRCCYRDFSLSLSFRTVSWPETINNETNPPRCGSSGPDGRVWKDESGLTDCHFYPRLKCSSVCLQRWKYRLQFYQKHCNWARYMHGLGTPKPCMTLWRWGKHNPISCTENAWLSRGGALLRRTSVWGFG
jgi:hypothetical protein